MDQDMEQEAADPDTMKSAATNGDGDVVTLPASAETDTESEESDEDIQVTTYAISLHFRPESSSKYETELCYVHQNEALKWRYIFEVGKVRELLKCSLQQQGAIISETEKADLPVVECIQAIVNPIRWKRLVKKEIGKISSQIEVKEISIIPGTFKATIELALLGSTALQTRDVICIEGRKMIWVVGRNDSIDKCTEDIKRAVAHTCELVPGHRQETVYQKYIRKYSDRQVALARTLRLGMFYPGVIVSVSEERCVVSTEGPVKLACIASEFIDKLLNETHEERIIITDDIREFLLKKKVRESVKERLQKQALHCDWTFVGNQLSVVAVDDSVARFAANEILEIVVHKELRLQGCPRLNALVHSAQWGTTLSSISDLFGESASVLYKSSSDTVVLTVVDNAEQQLLHLLGIQDDCTDKQMESSVLAIQDSLLKAKESEMTLAEQRIERLESQLKKAKEDIYRIQGQPGKNKQTYSQTSSQVTQTDNSIESLRADVKERNCERAKQDGNGKWLQTLELSLNPSRNTNGEDSKSLEGQAEKKRIDNSGKFYLNLPSNMRPQRYPTLANQQQTNQTINPPFHYVQQQPGMKIIMQPNNMMPFGMRMPTPRFSPITQRPNLYQARNQQSMPPRMSYPNQATQFGNPITYFNTPTQSQRPVSAGGIPTTQSQAANKERHPFQIVDPNTGKDISVELSTNQTRATVPGEATNLSGSTGSSISFLSPKKFHTLSPSPEREIAAQFAAQVAAVLRHPEEAHTAPAVLKNASEVSAFHWSDSREKLHMPEENQVEQTVRKVERIHPSTSKDTIKCEEDNLEPTNLERRTKKQYDREFLLNLQFNEASLFKPKVLPDIPDIILDKPHVSQQYGEPVIAAFVTRYVWDQRPTLAGNRSKVRTQAVKPQWHPPSIVESEERSSSLGSTSRESCLGTSTGAKLEYTKGGDCAPTTPTKWASVKKIKKQLDDLLRRQKADNEAVFDWIEEKVDDSTTKKFPFIRALMTSVCESAIAGEGNRSRVDQKEIKRRNDLLRKYMDHQVAFELEALYALQALVHRLKHPPDVLRQLFDTFHDEDIISEDAFIQWEKSDDPKEQEGKDVAMKQVAQFFTWLKLRSMVKQYKYEL